MTTEIVELPDGIARVLRRKDDKGVTTLTLNRPQSGNSLSHQLVHELQDTLDDIRDDRSVRVVILAAAGRLFCTGHDLNESVEAMKAPETKRAATASCSRMMQSLLRLPQPVIARVHGIATAAGCELVASCDLVYASSEAKFATPGVNIGFWCHSPQVAVSRAVAPKHAMQMLLTGKLMDAETAFRMGLVSAVVAPDKLAEAVNEVGARYRREIGLCHRPRQGVLLPPTGDGPRRGLRLCRRGDLPHHPGRRRARGDHRLPREARPGLAG